MMQVSGYYRRWDSVFTTEEENCWEKVEKIASVDLSAAHPALKEAQFTVVCDVRNPFCGSDGAAYMYAPQKGANAEMVRMLDDGLASFAQVIHATIGKDVTHTPRTGAAGGLEGGLFAFLQADLKSGIQLVWKRWTLT